MTERVRPFAEGASFIGWKSRNCDRCTLRWQEGRGMHCAYLCDIEAALDYAYMDDGTVTEVVGRLVRFDGTEIADPCPERVLVEVEGGGGQTMEEIMSIPQRLRPLLLTMTKNQRRVYDDTCKAVELELTADRKRPFVLRDGHQLFIAERVIADQPVDFNEAVRFYTPNPHTPKLSQEETARP